MTDRYVVPRSFFVLFSILVAAACTSEEDLGRRATGEGPDSGTAAASDDGVSGGLDSEDQTWLARDQYNNAVVLYTYAASSKVIIDVRDSVSDAAKSQCTGVRKVEDSLLVLDLNCTSGPFASKYSTPCTATDRATPELLCNDLLFERVDAATVGPPTASEDIARDAGKK